MLVRSRAWRVALGAAACAVVLSAGCHREGPAERAGRKIDDAAEDTADAMKRAGQDAKDAAEKLGDDVQDAVD